MNGLLVFIRENWFKLAIAGLLLFLVFKNQLNIEMNVEEPSKVVAPQQPAMVRKGIRERLTDLFSSDKQSQTDRLAIKPFSGAGSDMAAFKELESVPASLRDAFISRFRKVAIEEQKKFGIPASIILANALLISKAGESAPVQQGLNFFGLPCTPDWQGEQGTLDGTCYRFYETAWMSFRDHSLYLTTGDFSSTAELKGKSYADWAISLESAGFKPVANYSMQVLEVIQTYRLDQWD